MKKMHRLLAAVALSVAFSSGVILSSLGLASAQEPDVGITPIITFPVDAGRYNEEEWNAGCDPVGFCGTATESVTGSGVQNFEISIQQLDPRNYWDGTEFQTGSEVFVMAAGLTDWSYRFSFGDFPADGDYTVRARATDDSDNVEETPPATFTIDTGPPPVTPPKPPKDGIREGKPRGFTGVVDGEQGSVPLNPFTLIRQGTGESVEIHLPSDEFKFKTPGGPWKGVFEGGARVVVLARWTDGMWIAEKGLVKPAKPTFTPSVGVVVSQINGELTLSLPNGKEITITISGEGSPSKVGEVVTVFAEQADENDGAPVKATGLVRASEVSRRLERFLEDVNESPGQLPERAKWARSKRVANIALALDSHWAKHVAILQRLTDRPNLPPQARGAIGRALANSKQGRDKSLKIAANAREKAGPPEGRGKPDSAGQGNTGRGNAASAAQDARGKGKPDSAGHSKTGRDNAASAAQDERRKGKPDSAGQGKTGRDNTASATQDARRKGKPDPAGQGKTGRDNAPSSDQGQKDRGKAGSSAEDGAGKSGKGGRM